MKIDFVKIIITILASIYFVWCGYDEFNNVFMHAINLSIHETGHTLFRPLGQFIYVAGGSMFQIIVPICCTLYFFYRQELFSSFITLFWVGNNFFDVATYANDAMNMDLPLWSFTGNSETTIHDWNYLLASTNLLPQAHLVANIIAAIGIIITIVAIIGAFYNSRQSPIFN